MKTDLSTFSSGDKIGDVAENINIYDWKKL